MPAEGKGSRNGQGEVQQSTQASCPCFPPCPSPFPRFPPINPLFLPTKACTAPATTEACPLQFVLLHLSSWSQCALFPVLQGPSGHIIAFDEADTALATLFAKLVAPYLREPQSEHASAPSFRELSLWPQALLPLEGLDNKNDIITCIMKHVRQVCFEHAAPGGGGGAGWGWGSDQTVPHRIPAPGT